MKLLLLVVVVCAAAASVRADEEFGFSSGRVTGGQNAVPHSAPWIVTLQWGATVPSQHCGGSIISPAWVVTAAHCLGGRTDTGVFIMIAGRHNIHIEEPASEQRRNINRARTWSHPQYAGGVGPFDIGMIHAAPAFTFNTFVQPIALPAAGFIHSGTATLHGWGSTSSTIFPTFPAILQTVTKPIIPMAQCVAVLGAASPVHETNVCTGPLTGGISACSGDSGGPLVQAGQLVGIVSWGTIPCGTPNRPSMYVRTSAFNAWINGIMQL